MRFFTRGDLYRRLRKLKSIINWTDEGIATLLDDEDHNEIIESARRRYQKELNEYSILKKLYDKLNDIRKNPVDCPCCKYLSLKNVAISEDGNLICGPECKEHFTGENPCNRFQKGVLLNA